jgi:thioredoxin reductase
VGGGPAGLSAALVLGRCRRRVLLLDDGQYRNYAARAMHGFLTRDGIDPAELRRIGCDQLAGYGVEYRRQHATGARRSGAGFEVALEGGAPEACRKLLIATGVVDRLPAVEGAEALYGIGIHHCPYCDGWEHRDEPLAAYGKARNGAALAMALKTWSPNVVLCTDGASGLKTPDAERLARHGIPVREQRIRRLEGGPEGLERVVFENGEVLLRRAMFFTTGQRQRCDLAEQLGCLFTRKGAVHTGKLEGTNVPGLFVAGDASKDVQLAIVAAAEGAKAAVAINTALQEEDRR